MIQEFHRRSIRVPGYDYAAPGAYFVTICVQDRLCLFGETRDDHVVLDIAGLMVGSWWEGICQRFPMVGIDAFVVMPNHLHGILRFENEELPSREPVIPQVTVVRGQGENSNLAPSVGATQGGRPRPDALAPPTLGAVVGWFKTVTTNDYIRGVRSGDFAPFDGRLWQRNYYERIVRNERELDRFRAYIAGNPARWADDPERPR